MQKVFDNQMLSTFSGTVVKGRQVGRTIGFPTANVEVHSDIYFPALNGVYSVKVQWQGQQYYGIMNIGVKPTFETQEREKTFEVHIFQFEHMIYGDMIDVEIMQFIREEKKFESVDALKAQIAKDCEVAKKQMLKKNVRTTTISHDQLIHSPDLQFSRFCEQQYGINRGIYNTIDQWFAEQQVAHIIKRRIAILHFLNWVSIYVPKEKKVTFGSKGLTEQLSYFKQHVI